MEATMLSNYYNNFFVIINYFYKILKYIIINKRIKIIKIYQNIIH